MRGKLLFLFVALLCVIFAISINAATTNEFADTAEKLDGISLDGMSSDTVSKVVLVHTEGENTIYTTYPAQYIVTSNSTLEFDFSKISSAGGPTYSASSIVRIQIPTTVTLIGVSGNNSVLTGKTALVEIDFSNTTQQLGLGHNCFKGCTGLTSVYLPDNVYFPSGSNNYQFSGCSNITTIRLPSVATRIPASCFAGCSNLTTIQNFPTGVTEIGANAFENCGNLTSTLDLSNVTSVGKRAFRYCSNLKFANVNQLEYVDGDAFQGCPNLTSVTFGPNLSYIGGYAFNGTNLTYIKFNGGNFTIGGNAFGAVKYEGAVDFSGCRTIGSNNFNSSSFTSVNLGNNMTSVDTSSFKSCSKMTTVILGARLQTLGGYAFQSPTALTTVYVPDTATSMASTAFSGVNSSCTVYVTSVDTSYINTVKNTFSSQTIVSGYNKCKAFYNEVHTYKGTGDCTEGVTCEICLINKTDFTEHNMVETLVYPNGFTVVGVYNKHCSNALDCTVGKVVDGQAPAIFAMNEFNGFSESGKDGIAFGGYCLNATALDEYNRVNKDAPVKYGVVLINPDYLDGKDSFFKDGKVNSTTENKGFLQTDMSSARYANISISVTGFTGNAENLSLILAIYAYTDDSDVEFIQSQTTKCASERVTLGETSLYTVTLASVKAGNSNLSDLGDYVMPSDKEEE